MTGKGGVPPLVLASRSPRRAALLEMLGLGFEVVPAEIDETPRTGEPPATYVERLAVEKARAVHSRRPEALVIGGDTTVVVDGAMLHQPVDPEDAVQMLRALSGRVHEVLSGVAVATPRGSIESAIARTRVRFRELDDEMIADYLATGEPMDKAGGYGIQGWGAALVAGIDGDYFNVVGLPIVTLLQILETAGFRYDFGGLTPVVHPGPELPATQSAEGLP